MVKKALVCQRTERIPEYIDLAYRMARSGRPGPVYLELPVDVLNGPDPYPAKKRSTEVESHPADPDQWPKYQLIRQARQPIVIAGSGAWYAGAERPERIYRKNRDTGFYRGAGTGDHPRYPSPVL